MCMLLLDGLEMNYRRLVAPPCVNRDVPRAFGRRECMVRVSWRLSYTALQKSMEFVAIKPETEALAPE
jgi:hypothetical protein